MGCSWNCVAGVGRDADKSGSELVVEDVVEYGFLIRLGVQPAHVIQLACQHQVVMLRCHFFSIIPCCIPASGKAWIWREC